MGTARTAEKQKRRIQLRLVSAPGYKDAPVSADDDALATVLAAKGWGVPWARIAAECTVKRIGVAWACICRRCKKEFITELPAERCPICEKMAREEARVYFARYGKREDPRLSGN